MNCKKNIFVWMIISYIFVIAMVAWLFDEILLGWLLNPSYRGKK